MSRLYSARSNLIRTNLSWRDNRVSCWHSVSPLGTNSFNTLGLHTAEHSHVFLITRFFKMGRTKRSVLRCWILEVMSMSADELNPFGSHNWIFRGLIHSNAQRERPVLTTLLIRSTSNAISALLSLACLTFRYTELTLWHSNDVSGSCHVVFSPPNLNTIFEGKMVQLSRLVKSSILTLTISNFGIVCIKIIFTS